LTDREYTTIQEGKVNPERPIALIGAGTGLGECFLTPDGGRYTAHPSEGGHTEFGPRSALENELLAFLQKKFGREAELGRVSAERIVSGKGIENVYEFLAQRFPDQVDERHHKLIMDQEEPAKVRVALVAPRGIASTEPGRALACSKSASWPTTTSWRRWPWK
jgi:glucokinase